MVMGSRRVETTSEESERDPGDRDGWLYVMLVVCLVGMMLAIDLANVHSWH